MCQRQRIPPLDRIERVRAQLEANQIISEDEQDILSLHESAVGSNDQIVEHANHATATLDVANLESDLLNQGRIRVPFTLSSDYEDIFDLPGLSRRSDRLNSTNDPNVITGEQQLLIEDWAELCLECPHADMDEILPGDMSAFHSLVEHGMPNRVSVDSYIGIVLLNIMAEDFPFQQSRDCFMIWQPEMGTDQFTSNTTSEWELVTNVNFLGTAGAGRLVWAPMSEYSEPLITVNHEFVEEMEQTIRSAEAALVALARRIARCIACSIVHRYAIPKAEERGYEIIDRGQIIDAVREILGEDWFDLPFDVDGELLNWSEEDAWVIE